MNLRDYGRLEKPIKINQSFDVYFVPVDVYLHNKRSNNIRLFLSLPVHRLTGDNTDLLSASNILKTVRVNIAFT